MTIAPVGDRIQARLAALLDTSPEVVTPNSLLVDDLDADSLDLLELVIILQEDFGIHVADGEMKSLLIELARFMPDEFAAPANDEEVAGITHKLAVRHLIEFVEVRTSSE